MVTVANQNKKKTLDSIAPQSQSSIEIISSIFERNLKWSIHIIDVLVLKMILKLHKNHHARDSPIRGFVFETVCAPVPVSFGVEFILISVSVF